MPWPRPIPPLAALSACAVALSLAGAARADKLLFQGEHAIRFSHNGVLKEVVATGTGVATVNGSGGGIQVNTVQLTRPFATIDETATIMLGGPTPSGIAEIHFDGVKINPKLAGPNGVPGIFAPVLSAAKGMSLTRSTLAAAGTIRICNFTGCPESVPIQLSRTNAGVAIGPGVGGMFTAMGMTGMGGPGPTVVTVTGNPWTVNTVAASYVSTMGMVVTFMDTGFVSGPMSMTGTTLSDMGVGGKLQLVTATKTTCTGCSGSNSPSGQITRLTLTFAPEPGLLLLLGSGAVVVALLGTRRIRRTR